VATNGLGFYPVTPCRVADTRVLGGMTGPYGPPSMPGKSSRDFPVAASPCGIPSTARVYALNITVVPPGPLIYLSIWPTGQPMPIASTLNAFDGQVVANTAIVPAGDNGSISVYVSNPTDVLIDINGYFAPPNGQELAFYPSTPCRVADTRILGGITGVFGPPSIAAHGSRTFPVPSSSCGIPASAKAYSLNITVVPPGPLIYLTTWGAGTALPVVSTLNSFNGRVAANAAIVPAGTGGVSLYVSDATDVIVDINGYFASPGSPGALYFYPTTPCRVADTRVDGGFSGAFGPPAIAGERPATS